MTPTTARFAPNYDPFACEWEEAIDAVRDLDRFGTNWDGEGADAVRPELISTAEEWLATCRGLNMPPPGAVYPTPGGSVMLEWQLPDHGAIAAHVRQPGKVEVVFRQEGQKPQFVVIHVATEWDESYPVREPSPYLEGGEYSLAA